MTSPLDQQLDAIADRWNLLRHPFYQAWIAGTLQKSELRDYACQYAHVVAAIPRWLEAAAQSHPHAGSVLLDHAREESEHVALWRDFSCALGVSDDAIAATSPNAATKRLIDAGNSASASGNGAAFVWALEAQSPAVSAEKLDGLQRHYAMASDSGAGYFALHARLDVDHERELRDIMRSASAQSSAALSAAETSIAGLWDLLTSVYHPTVAAD